MIKRLVLVFSFLALGPLAHAQNVTDVFGIAVLARNTPTVLATLTGSDGAACKLVKQPSATIYATWQCTSADGNAIGKTYQITATGTNSHFLPVGLDTILCLIGINPTATANSFGTVGSAPANGIAWSCTGDAKTSQNGTALWP